MTGGCRFRRYKNDFGSARLPYSGPGGPHQILVRVVVETAVDGEVGSIVRATFRGQTEADFRAREMTMTTKMKTKVTMTMKGRVEILLVLRSVV